MESFQPSGASTHRPLQDSEIRVVTLHPASWYDPVSCTLDHVVLDGPRDDYIAISYTWGDPTQTKDIELNGHSYPVTTNLHLALRYLRNKDKPRRLWIDSLCIDQRDVAERSAQIPRMRDVYAFAAEVHIWLGDYGSTPNRYTLQYTFDRCIADAAKDKKTFHGPKSDSVINTLLKRPWFQRMWVIQEVAVRNWKEDGEKVTFLVGHSSLTWSILGWACRDMVHLQSNPKQLVPGRNYETNGFLQIRTAWEAQHRVRESPIEGVSYTMSQQLGYLLSRFVNFKVTDPRDRIYSLLGLLYGPGEVPDDLAPDYSKPVDEVFHAYAAWMLRSGACIDILSLNSRQRVGRRCPSWVPDFRGEEHEIWQNLVSNPVKILHHDRVLEIDTLAIGTVHTAGKRCDILAKSKTKSDTCRQYFLDCESYQAFPSGHRMFYGKVYDTMVRDPEPGGLGMNKKMRRNLPYTRAFADFIASQFDGFAPFICGNGKLEFCDSKVDVPEPGDVLCLLRGSSKQYILRRAPPDSLGKWIMVGTTYNAAFRRGKRSEEEVNIAYTELWTKNADKIFKALIC
ncbi:HET-domain-containing protein [Neurospora tetrasperma FGSC 2509]|nr:HET-domain-containing protein [Neurospora tetrasperma FGSC 2509]